MMNIDKFSDVMQLGCTWAGGIAGGIFALMMGYSEYGIGAAVVFGAFGAWIGALAGTFVGNIFRVEIWALAIAIASVVGVIWVFAKIWNVK